MKKLFSISLILFIAYMTGNVSARIFDISKSYKTNNYETVAYHVRNCTPTASAGLDKKVVLRVDDIQKGYLLDVQEKMILDAKSRGMKLVLGVIPRDILDEPELVGMIKNNFCMLEIAQHGLTHNKNGNYEDPEFLDISDSETKKKIDEGRKILSNLTRKPISTFIPPVNQISENVKNIILSNGFKVISSEGDEQFDYDHSTYNWIENELVDVTDVMNGCDRAFAENGVCIIMMHPQNYSTNGKLDKEKYKKYTLLLDRLQQESATTLTFQEL